MTSNTDDEKSHLEQKVQENHSLQDLDTHSNSEDNTINSSNSCNDMPNAGNVIKNNDVKKDSINTIKKLPDLPSDLEPLKRRCTNMSQEVLHLLCQKIKEDMIVCKEKKDHIRTQQLRELSWKVTDMLALGSSAVKEIESKSTYQLQRERESKKYQNKKNRNWAQKSDRFNDNNVRGSSRNRNNHSRGQQNGRRKCDSDKNWRKRSDRFNSRDAKKFCEEFVQQIISNSITVLLKEHNDQYRQKVHENIDITKNLIDSILCKTIDVLVIEASCIKENLSLTETELLTDMCEESFSCEENAIMMNVASQFPIKSEASV